MHEILLVLFLQKLPEMPSKLIDFPFYRLCRVYIYISFISVLILHDNPHNKEIHSIPHHPHCPPFCVQSQVSLTESEIGQKEFLPISFDYEIKQHRPLRLKKKIYEFYTAPITKFWADSVSI